MTANISLILIPWSASDVWVQPPKWVIYHFHQILSGKQELPPQVWTHFPKKRNLSKSGWGIIRTCLKYFPSHSCQLHCLIYDGFHLLSIETDKKPFSRYKINASKTEKYPSRLKLCWEAGKTKQKPSLSDSFQKHNFSNRRLYISVKPDELLLVFSNEMIRRWWVVYRTPTGSGNNGNHCPSQSL